MDALASTVASHYGQTGLDKIMEAKLREAGLDPNNLNPKDLTSFEEFHLMGRPGTRHLAEMAGIQGTDKVLDVGSGIGGPSRFLANEFGCQVEGIDLTPEYVATANYLAKAVGVDDRVTFRPGSGLNIPFEPETFDVVWLQHVGMNIPDKPRLYSEVHRVLKPGGRFAFHEVLHGEGEVTFPVPWSRDGNSSFLLTPDQTRADLERSGLKLETWEDASEDALSWLAEMKERMAQTGPPVLGLHLVLGPDFPEMFANVGENLRKGAIRVVFGVCRKG